jgi:hypothetical protein
VAGVRGSHRQAPGVLEAGGACWADAVHHGQARWQVVWQNRPIYKSTSTKTTIEIVVITYFSPYKPGNLRNLEGSQTFSTYSQDRNGSVITVHMLT